MPECVSGSFFIEEKSLEDFATLFLRFEQLEDYVGGEGQEAHV